MGKTAAQILGLRITRTSVSMLPPKDKDQEDNSDTDLFEIMRDLFEDVTEDKEEKEEDKEARDKNHGKKAVEIHERDGVKIVCPHCGDKLEEKDIYTDKKGWKFCRVCFRKGKGAILISEKKSSAPVFGFEYTLPPDPEVFDLEKLSQFKGAPPPGTMILQPPGVKYKTNPGVNALNSSAAGGGLSAPVAPHEGLGKYLPYTLPALGAGAGYVTADEEEEEEPVSNSVLRGLATGTGALGGSLLGSKLSGGDIGAGLTGAASGGLLAYLASRALI